MAAGAAGSGGVLYGFDDERLDGSIAKMGAREVKSRAEGVTALLAVLEEGAGAGGVPGRHAASIAEALIPLTRDNNPKIV